MGGLGQHLTRHMGRSVCRRRPNVAKAGNARSGQRIVSGAHAAPGWEPPAPKPMLPTLNTALGKSRRGSKSRCR